MYKILSKIVFSDEIMENFELFLFIETLLKDLLRSYLAYELIQFNRMDTFAVARHRLSSGHFNENKLNVLKEVNSTIYHSTRKTYFINYTKKEDLFQHRKESYPKLKFAQIFSLILIKFIIPLYT